MRTSKFELVIDLETARILKIEFPAAPLFIADEVIEWVLFAAPAHGSYWPIRDLPRCRSWG